MGALDHIRVWEERAANDKISLFISITIRLAAGTIGIFYLLMMNLSTRRIGVLIALFYK